jgi:hypothetical protein
MANQSEFNSLESMHYYSPPPQLMVYGPQPVAFHHDGFQPGGEDFTDQSFPCHDAFAPPARALDRAKFQRGSADRSVPSRS